MPLAEMVPGDVARLGADDLVPCDEQVLEALDFFVNQVLLTGEPFLQVFAKYSSTQLSVQNSAFVIPRKAKIA
jgi:magnesium-transporting ATPase (P-type)